jgi:hypothetical protein
MENRKDDVMRLLTKIGIGGDDQELIFEFFITFSRFEYSLKRMRFLDKSKQYAKPDWMAYSNCLSLRYSQMVPELKRLGKEFDKPPKEQRREGDRIKWKIMERGKDENDIDWILRCIRTVRNNLFHGGKFPWNEKDPDNHPEVDPVRNRKLVFASLDILECIIKTDVELQKFYWEGG